MRVILVIIIVGAWIVILGPNILKRRSHSVGGSVSHFHRALRTLEHTAPEPIVPPAYRLHSGGEAAPGTGDPESPPRPVLTAVGADKLPRPALAFLGDPAPLPDPAVGANRAGAGRGVATPARALALASAAAPTRGALVGAPADDRGPLVEADTRRLVRRRRRDTLGILAAVFVGTLLIGLIPGAGAAWIVTAIAGTALAAYVGLLVRLRRIAEEREQKLRYLGTGPRTARALPNGSAATPVTMSGRYAHPSNQAVAAR